jgi:hypothetical protein
LLLIAGLPLLLLGCGGKKERLVMSETEFDVFIQDCRAELRQKIATSVEKWKLDKFARFNFDQEKGQIEFLDGQGPTSFAIFKSSGLNGPLIHGVIRKARSGSRKPKSEPFFLSIF